MNRIIFYAFHYRPTRLWLSQANWTVPCLYPTAAIVTDIRLQAELVVRGRFQTVTVEGQSLKDSPNGIAVM